MVVNNPTAIAEIKQKRRPRNNTNKVVALNTDQHANGVVALNTDQHENGVVALNTDQHAKVTQKFKTNWRVVIIKAFFVNAANACGNCTSWVIKT